MRGSGGTQGGCGTFAFGLGLSVLAAWLFFDSVRVSTDHAGWISGFIGGYAGNGSAIVVFVPFFFGVLGLFYDAKAPWAWMLTYAGIGILCIEILSRLQFYFNGKLTYLLLMMIMFAGGMGMMLRSFREYGAPRAGERD